MSSFRTVAAQHNYPEKEEEVLAFWKKIDAFQRSMQISEEEGRPEFTFYDGPPFATGLPHYGHILAGTIKDVVTRFAYQTGFHVSRRFGWDTHGLPVEHEIDKKLNITSKQDVMDMGIAAYNKECRSIVTRYCAEWEEIVTRLGRWIDFKNDYKTLEPWYMESVWWVFKTISDKDLVYRGYRVMPYSTGCTTPLSNFEANLNYKEVSDPAVVVSFPLVEDPETSFLAWTTTPWTLPSNLALCVHPESKYVKVKDNATGRQYILMEKRLLQVYPKMAKKGYKNDEFVVLETYTGADLKGMRYEPLFPYFKDHPNAFQVLNDTYVTEDGGTGVVHQAPAFGEDDNRVCEEHGVLVKGGPLPCPIDENGCFDDTVPDYVGLYVKDADNKICAKLKENGRLISKGSIKHSYPFCWRSETPLIYKIVPSWFVSVTTIKERLVANNLETYWVPQNVREKRFHNWLVNARDWNVSRNRYWGTPIPVWISDDGEERVVVGSIQELEELSGEKVTDLHRESIDHITIPSKEGRGDLKRIEEVFDCWFESGSMPYAQQHYPFENKEKFQEKFPADFIAEGLDQTRGWFYTLMVLSTALFDRPAFKNLIVNGLVLAEDGKKMSKSKKNYPDPMLVINEYGSDAIRLYLINSPVVRAEPLKFRKGGVADVRKNVFNPWYNSYRFFVQNAQRLELDTGAVFETSKAEELAKKSENVMDRWIMASLHRLIEFVRGEMSAYRLYTVVPELLRFGEQLTNWYVRLNRQRLKGVAPGQTNEDVHVALSTLYVVLLNLTKLMSPITPFFTEFMYQELVQPDENSKQASVHFCQLPEFDPEQIDKDIEKTMSFLQTTITLGRLCRERRGTLSMKQPVSSITVVVRDAEVVEKLKALERYIKAELNTRNITWSTDQEKWCTLEVKLLMQVNFKKLDISDEAKDQWQEKCKELGSRLGRDVGKVMKGMSALTAQEILDFETTGSVTVAGHTLTMDDVEFVRKARKGLGDHLEMDSSDGVTLVLDTNLDESLVQEGLVREVLNRIQKLRKSAELEFQDKVEFFFDVVPEIERDAFNPIEQLKGDKATQHVNELVAAIKGGDQMINETLRGGTLFPISRCPEFAVRVADARDVVHGVTLRLVLTRPSVSFPATAKLASDLGVDEATVQAVKTTVGFTSYATIVQHVAEQKSLKVSLGGNFSGSYELVPNKHFFAEVPKEE